MRVELVAALREVLENDPSCMLITGDLGYNALEGLAARHPRRFINAGVAEQNMIGVAAGAALAGMRPWVYSIAPFATLRCLEQIRNDVCLHRLPVRIVGNGGGYTYGIMGATHHALEDLAVMRSLPNMQLFFPCSSDQVAEAVSRMAELSGPSYIRLAISPYTTEAVALSENARTLTRRYGGGSGPEPPALTIIGVGHGLQIVLRWREGHRRLAPLDVFGVAHFPWDFDADSALAESVARSGNVIVVEEHYRDAGMGESLRLHLPEARRFQVLAARYSPQQLYGSSEFHLRQCGLTPEALDQAIEQALRWRGG